MSDWGQGYHVGIAYTLGFYSELAPSHLEAALLFAGLKSDLAGAGARYCELGCGYGLTTLVLAAANPQMSFVGVDFNPTHIVAARALAESARLPNIRFVEASFDELMEPRFADLGEFDVIALHGIYSWVAPSVRHSIVRFADARLKTGGALYVSYNAAPGWMPRAPLQRLIFEYAKRHPAAAPRATTADALRFAKTVKDAGALYFHANPQVGAFIESMEGKDLTYLVHENLNESWSALYHADVAADFAATRLSYACAAHIADDIDETSIPITTHNVLAGISDGVWRETVKDFLVARSFRRDIFVRGPVQLTPAERTQELDRDFVLTVPRSAATTGIQTPMGEVKGRADLYSPILDRLAEGPVRLSRLLAQLGPDKPAPAVIQALALLIHSGQVKMVRPDVKTDWEPARRLNVALTRELAAGKSVRVLAAPAVGTAVGADLCDFGYVAAREQDLRLDAETIARTTWKMIENTSIRPMRDGKLRQHEPEALAYLREAAERLLAEKMGILKMLGV